MTKQQPESDIGKSNSDSRLLQDDQRKPSTELKPDSDGHTRITDPGFIGRERHEEIW